VALAVALTLANTGYLHTISVILTSCH